MNVAIGIYFAPTAMTPEKYDEVMRKLEATGQGAPKGRTYHAAFFEADGLHVFDVWDSQEDFDAFGAVLMPILTEGGIDPGQPQVAQVHNVVIG